MSERSTKISNVKYSDIYQHLDYDALYADLGFEPRETVGAEDKGQCLDPWHMHKNGDRTGKLAINRIKGVYNCWVCGGGTVLSLVMEAKGIDHDEALRYLGRFVNAHHKESAEEFYSRVAALLDDPVDADRPIPHFNPRVIEKWQGHHDWLRERNISVEVGDYFKVGVDSRHTKYHPRHGSYEGEAVILPHFWQGRLVGWQERWISDTPRWIGKYTNTTDFPRDRTLWGFDFAKERPKQPILVESVPTALMLISEGYPAIATFGSNVTPAQLKHLRGFQQGLLLAPDNDPPGDKWYGLIYNALHRFIPLLEVPVVEGSGSDLGDLPPDKLSFHLRGVKIAHPNV